MSYFILTRCSSKGSQKAGFQTVVLADVPWTPKTERGYKKTERRYQNRNEGTQGRNDCTKNRNEGKFAKTTFVQDRPFASSRCSSKGSFFLLRFRAMSTNYNQFSPIFVTKEVSHYLSLFFTKTVGLLFSWASLGPISLFVPFPTTSPHPQKNK